MKLAALLIVILILSAVLIFNSTFVPERKYFDKNCFASIEYIDMTESGSVSFQGNVLFDFDDDKTAELNISGGVAVGGKKYVLSRAVHLNYKYIIDNKYTYNVKNNEKMVHDNIPDDMSDIVLRVLGVTNRNSVYMRDNGSYITMGTHLSPVANCVIQ